MLKNFFPKIFITILMLGKADQINVQNLWGLNDGMGYFLYGSIAFIGFAVIFTTYFLSLKNKYQKKAVLVAGQVYSEHRPGRSWKVLTRKWVVYSAIVAGMF